MELTRAFLLPTASYTAQICLPTSKKTIETTQSLDFLKDIASSIPEPAGGEEEEEHAERAPKKRAQKSGSSAVSGPSGSSKLNTNGTASVSGVGSTIASASSSSMPPVEGSSSSGLKKIKISHNASTASPAIKSEETPLTATSSMLDSPYYSNQSQPQSSTSDSKVAIPISSLLTDNSEDYAGNANEQDEAKQEEVEEDEHKPATVLPPQISGSRVIEGDNYDDDDDEDDSKMQSEPSHQTTSGTLAAPEVAPVTTNQTYRRDEDDNYDDE